MGHIGRVNFILLFGIILSIPLMINYYVIKILITLLSFFFISWDYTHKELLIVLFTCMLLGILFGIYVQSKRMVVASMEQEGNGNSYLKITFHNKELLRNTDKVKIVWDFEQEIIQSINYRSKLKIPYDSNSINAMKGPIKVNFIDDNGYVIYKTKTV
ncbi:hypothetical protein [Paucisalibacillus sp. EB02]|uniref:hypothetical protein n=1 Tax=Paucisalibacillus sp. EB02 TaxID=1347087 RepID=UPI0005AAA861|nr:hypothetical protein [Paucisalibacillus sp. EB02]